MGVILNCKCNKCGYTFKAFVGSGMMYDETYAETVAKMKKGQFGLQGKEFFEAFPQGAISCERIVVQCDDCGELMTVPDLSLYVPEGKIDYTKTEREIPWPSELDEHYKLYEGYSHRCSRCNGHTSVVPGFTEQNKHIDRHVKCPKCGTIMKIAFAGVWD